MKFPSLLKSFRKASSAFALLAMLVRIPALACGPDFPNRYMDASDEAVLGAPEGYFAAEIARLQPLERAPFQAVNGQVQTSVEASELLRALSERGMDRLSAFSVASECERMRIALDQRLRAQAEAGSARGGISADNASEAERLPSALPAEFRLYLAGASSYHENHYDEARAFWTDLLKLPESERRYRSVWASYMLGRLAVAAFEDTDPNRAFREATDWFKQTRTLAAEGFRDSVGLAAASYGWEARSALRANAFPAAFNLYLTQYTSGDETALESLRRSARDVFAQSDQVLSEVAQDAISRRIVTAFILSSSGMGTNSSWDADVGSERTERWSRILQASGIVDLPQADRLAWLAYEAGDFETAGRCVQLAPTSAPQAIWIGAKLSMRAGDIAKAETLLTSLTNDGAILDIHRAQIWAELARVRLARDDFEGALRAWLSGGHWEDAAYVAERLMSLQELQRFVPTQADPLVVTAEDEVLNNWADARATWRPDELGKNLQALLARRLLREGHAEDARRWVTEEIRPVFDDYVRSVKRGFDLQRPAQERAEAFWKAAQIAREQGLELMGTELAPDAAIWGGSFSGYSFLQDRMAAPSESPRVLGPTQEEMRRVKEQKAPARRFHYRYRAAELAWWAASLLPNDDEQAAEILVTAGGWLKARDPEAANPFYQSLVIRFGNTRLGREAAARHWFPPEIDPPEPAQTP